VSDRSVAEVERRLMASRPSRVADPARLRRRAATAVLLRDGGEGAELLLLRRVEREGDPWSGDVACPGGWQHEGGTLVDSALREAHEEVALPSSQARLIRALDDRPGWPWSRWLDFAVRPHVFEVTGDLDLRPEPREVASIRWIPLARLVRPDARRRFLWTWKPPGFPVRVPLLMPRIVVDDYDVWGMTLDVLRDLFARIE